jgi:micrococcal nuclease
MRFRKPSRSWTWPLSSLIFVALVAAFFNPTDPGITSPDIEYVQRVADGDTLVLGTGERVRLIGVDTPETKHPNKPVEYFGRKRARSQSGWPKESGSGLNTTKPTLIFGHKDRYGRTLAYIFLEDDTLLNAEIIRQGYGHAYTQFPFSRMEAEETSRPRNLIVAKRWQSHRLALTQNAE